MAERRMFAKTIIDSDAFLDMPLSTQALYFHLCMRADDDGFINNPKKIQRMIGASEDDVKLLIAKRFIIPFETGVVVIKHWKIHNYIAKDRYKETVYQEEKQQLELKDNGSYTMSPGCIQNVYSLETQDRLVKDREVENRENTLLIKDEREKKPTPEEIENEFEMLWTLYPKKQGSKKAALKSYQKARNKGTTFEKVKAGIEQYVLHYYHEHKDKNLQYMAYGSTWFNQERWNDEYNTEVKPTVQDIKSAVNLSSWGVK